MKSYKLNKTKNYIKNNNLILFVNGTNKNSNYWVITEQKLKTIKLDYYKVPNKVAINTFKNSIYLTAVPLIYGIVLFIKPQKNNKALSIKNVSNDLESLLITVLALKLNNKVYSTKQITSGSSFNYKENKLLMSQFCTVNLKLYFTKTS